MEIYSVYTLYDFKHPLGQAASVEAKGSQQFASEPMKPQATMSTIPLPPQMLLDSLSSSNTYSCLGLLLLSQGTVKNSVACYSTRSDIPYIDTLV